MADHQIGEQGMSKLAHAIRRSTALHVAMNITPPESTVDDLLDTADRLADWIKGSAEDAVPGTAGEKPSWQP